MVKLRVFGNSSGREEYGGRFVVKPQIYPHIPLTRVILQESKLSVH